MGIAERLQRRALEQAAKGALAREARAQGVTVEELVQAHQVTALSSEGFPCPTCREARPPRHTQMIVPNGSNTPRCPICEPELLWDDAYKQWKLANPTSPW